MRPRRLRVRCRQVLAQSFGRFSKRRRTNMGATTTVPAGEWRLSEPGTANTNTNMLRPAVSSGVDHELHRQREMPTEANFEGIVGQSSALRQALQLVERVATSDSTVLLLGETGTGKELIARAIHHRSPRRQRALVKVNCAAIPGGLLESELFAMSGAPSPAPSPRRWAGWNWRTKAPYFWTKWAISPSNSNPSCCAFCRSASSSAW